MFVRGSPFWAQACSIQGVNAWCSFELGGMSLFLARAVLHDIPLRERTLDLLRESAVAEGCESVSFEYDSAAANLSIYAPISMPEDYTVVSHWADEAIWHGLTNDDFDEDLVPRPPTFSTIRDPSFLFPVGGAPEAGGLSPAAGGLSPAAGGVSPAAEEQCNLSAIILPPEDPVQTSPLPLNALQQARTIAGWGEVVLSRLSLRHNPTRSGQIWVGLHVKSIKAVNSNEEMQVDGHFTLARLPAADWSRELKLLQVQAVCWDRPSCKALRAKYSVNEVYSKPNYALLDIRVQESPLHGSLFSLLKTHLGDKVPHRDLRIAFHLSLATWDGFRPERDIPEGL